ncbi:MAG: extracellular solute-binding protein [Alphaproteobacteria bacterium]|nr:extracellular solute-binding protein [Alphaproteobacteria bacterium]
MRIRNLGLTAAAAVLACALALPVQAQDISGTTLRVATWGGLWRDLVEKHVGSQLKGVKIEYSVGNPTETVAKLIAARGGEPPFDVIEVSPEVTEALVKGKLVQDLDVSKLPNSKGLPQFVFRKEHIVVGVSQDGVVYDVKKFAELGIPKPTRYSDLANPKLKGRVAFPDISHTEHWLAVVGLALDAGGDETKMEPALKKVVEDIKPAHYFVSSAALGQKFSAGEVWAAAWHAGWVVRLNNQGLNLGMSHTQMGPKHRGALLTQIMFITAGSKNVAAANAFINAYLNPASQYEHGKAAGFVPVNSEARKKLLGETDNITSKIMLLDDKDFNNAYLLDWNKLDAAKWREMWSRRPTN